MATPRKHRYRVVGPNPYLDVATGGIVTIAEDSPINVGAAVAAGCIEPMSQAAQDAAGSPSTTETGPES
ncbi:hypothetical protein [Cryptosporangium sp. NPDC051539]|uniref:hypothetical protein n=1 Tax=Cryptosporangium sp. NPDC051539 TaxID=3363962 RepID=UPI0037BB4870